MTNQKRGSAQLFHKARKKWDPTHGEGRAPGRPGAAKKKEEKEKRGSVGRRGKPGLHERPETNRRLPPAEPPEKRPEARPLGPDGKPLPRPLPGAMPLNPCIPAFQALLKKALAYPSTYEDHLLGQTLVKLRNKSVVIALGRDGGGLQLTVKLPRSGVSAVSKFSWASAASHGLGRKGWVTARFAPADQIPLRMLLGWVEESHLAVTAPPPKAPKPPR